MANIPVKDATGSTVYLKSDGLGTDPAPFAPVQNVFIQDQTTAGISLYLGQTLDAGVTFRTNQALDDTTIDITTTGTTPVVGDNILIVEGEKFAQEEITAVTPIAGNDYDVDVSMPLDYAFTTAATVTLQNIDMNVNGSVTPVEFGISPTGALAGIEWDINRMLVIMTHTGAGDDGLFGDQAQLTNGAYFRLEDGGTFNLFNARDNSDFASEGYDLTYSTRSGGGGSFGTRSRITFNGRDKRGIVLRLAADTDDKFVGVVRDNLTALSHFHVKVQGQVVDPN